MVSSPRRCVQPRGTLVFGSVTVGVALGATRNDVTMLVLRRGLLLAATGLALGVPLALGFAQFLRSMLYGVTTADLPTYLAATANIALVALAGCYLPARRAARIDSAESLRAE